MISFLTASLIEHEAKHILFNQIGVPGPATRLSVVLHFEPGTDQRVIDMQLDSKLHTGFRVSDGDLQLTLDDFSSRFLYPSLSKLADHVGYATWN